MELKIINQWEDVVINKQYLAIVNEDDEILSELHIKGKDEIVQNVDGDIIDIQDYDESSDLIQNYKLNVKELYIKAMDLNVKEYKIVTEEEGSQAIKDSSKEYTAITDTLGLKLFGDNAIIVKNEL